MFVVTVCWKERGKEERILTATSGVGWRCCWTVWDDRGRAGENTVAIRDAVSEPVCNEPIQFGTGPSHFAGPSCSRPFHPAQPHPIPFHSISSRSARRRPIHTHRDGHTIHVHIHIDTDTQTDTRPHTHSHTHTHIHTHSPHVEIGHLLALCLAVLLCPPAVARPDAGQSWSISPVPTTPSSGLFSTTPPLAPIPRPSYSAISRPSRSSISQPARSSISAPSTTHHPSLRLRRRPAGVLRNVPGRDPRPALRLPDPGRVDSALRWVYL